MNPKNLKEHLRSVIITRMCYTYRHDYGLDKLDDDHFTSGVTHKERMAIHNRMSQLYDNDISKVIDFLIDSLDEKQALDYDSVLEKVK